MDAFKTHRGIIAVLDTANVDTDQIIAKQFLKSIKKTGFGEHLFHDWRYLPDGNPDPDFSLNDPAYDGSSILVARNNFGCGSSREHAVWAIAQYGFRVVIAPSKGKGDDKIPGFADIFKNNCVKNGVLTIELGEDEVDGIFKIVENEKGIEASIDLESQTLTLHAKEERSFQFPVNPSTKNRLLNGLDDIGITLQEDAAISRFESSHNTQISLA